MQAGFRSGVYSADGFVHRAAREIPAHRAPYVSPVGVPGAALAMLVTAVTLTILFRNSDYNKGVIGAAAWCVWESYITRGMADGSWCWLRKRSRRWRTAARILGYEPAGTARNGSSP